MIPEGHPILAKNIDNLSAQTDGLRQLLKKSKKGIWTEEHTLAFENLKQKNHGNTVFDTL